MKKIDVVGAIIFRDEKILCAQRAMDKSLGGYWEFPGGKVERHETPHEALKRELIEELHIEPTIQIEPFETTTYLYDFGEVTLTTFICHLISGEPILTEHEDINWVSTKKEISKLNWAPADIPAVKKLIKLYIRR